MCGRGCDTAVGDRSVSTGTSIGSTSTATACEVVTHARAAPTATACSAVSTGDTVSSGTGGASPARARFVVGGAEEPAAEAATTLSAGRAGSRSFTQWLSSGCSTRVMYRVCSAAGTTTPFISDSWLTSDDTSSPLGMQYAMPLDDGWPTSSATSTSGGKRHGRDAPLSSTAASDAAAAAVASSSAQQRSAVTPPATAILTTSCRIVARTSRCRSPPAHCRSTTVISAGMADDTMMRNSSLAEVTFSARERRWSTNSSSITATTVRVGTVRIRFLTQYAPMRARSVSRDRDDRRMGRPTSGSGSWDKPRMATSSTDTGSPRSRSVVLPRSLRLPRRVVDGAPSSAAAAAVAAAAAAVSLSESSSESLPPS